MTRVLLAYACAVTLLAAGACRREDPTAKAIRATVSSANPPASFQNARWKLLRQVYADRDYRSLWLDGRKANGQARDLIETLCHAEREGLRVGCADLFPLLIPSQPDPERSEGEGRRGTWPAPSGNS